MAQAYHKNMSYKFDKARHHHSFDGKPLMGVTTVLGVIAKPMLIQWAADMAVDYIDRQTIRNDETASYPLPIWKEILEQARVAHRTKKEKAGDWGTRLHEVIENYIKYQKTDVAEDQKVIFDKFIAWVTENNVKFLESEKHIWSETMWTGGICDVVLEMNGKKYIGDFKTSSGIYNEAFFQIAAYDLMMQEMGLHKPEDIEGYIVINLRKDNVLDFKIAMDKELNQEAFKSALALYKIINSLQK